MKAAQCYEHKPVVAAWRCTECDRALCVNCAAPDALGKFRIVRCVHCRGLGEKLTYVPEIVPWPLMIRPIVRSILSLDGILQALALAIFMGFFSLAFIVGEVLTFLMITAYYFMVVAHAAEGEITLPNPAVSGMRVVPNLFRFLTTSWWLWAPFGLIWANSGSEGSLLLLFVPVVVFFLPATIIIASTGANLVYMVNPMSPIRLVLASPADYAVATLVWTGCVALARGVDFALELTLGRISIPFLMPMLEGMISLFVPVLSAMLLGRIFFQHGEALGVFSAEDRRTEQVPGAVPQADFDAEVLREQAEEPLDIGLDLSSDSYEDVSPPFEPAVGGGAMDDEDGIEVDWGDPVADLPDDPLQRYGGGIELVEVRPPTLQEALQKADFESAMAIYGSLDLTGMLEHLPAQNHIEVARIFESEGLIAEAARAWQRGAECDLNSPVAAAAIYGLAALMADKLSKPIPAQALFAQLVQRFPDHELADDARQRLNPAPTE